MFGAAMLKRLLIALSALTAAAGLAGPAAASQLIDRNATGVKLEVNKAGQALILYKKGGAQKHVLAWGAINALTPHGASAPGPQVEFKVDYSGGWGTYRKLVWKTFKNTCRPYDGPQLAWFVTGCKA